MSDSVLEGLKGKLGFGCMRMPMVDGKVDIPLFSKMVDIFLERGFNYFDTAHGYLDEQSESAIRAFLNAERSSRCRTLEESYRASPSAQRP